MSRSILLVEDEADARASLERTLTRAGYRCLVAASVDEAMDAAKAPTFLDVVVSDIVLGKDESGGIRLIGLLRDAGVGAPVVLITAFAAIDNVKRGLNEGASFLLEKPFRAEDLLLILRRVAEGPRGDIGWLVDRALAKANLTQKETSIARLLLKGLSSLEIARLENNSDKTVRQHISRIYQKCGVSSRPELFHFVFPW